MLMALLLAAAPALSLELGGGFGAASARDNISPAGNVVDVAIVGELRRGPLLLGLAASFVPSSESFDLAQGRIGLHAGFSFALGERFRLDVPLELGARHFASYQGTTIFSRTTPDQPWAAYAGARPELAFSAARLGGLSLELGLAAFWFHDLTADTGVYGGEAMLSRPVTLNRDMGGC